MAANADEKTEAPTPRRRREARSKGQVARSQDLTAAVLLFAAFLALRLIGPPLWETLVAVTATSLSADAPVSAGEVLNYTGAVALETFKRLAPFLLIILVAMLATLYSQIGLLFTMQPLIPSLNKISPLAGIKRLFSARMVMTACLNFGKLLVVAGLAYLTLSGNAAAVVFAFTFGLHDIFRLASSLTFELGVKLATAMLVLALLDLAWQRYRHERDLRMTKEEIKDEFRSMEGDPQIRRRRREVQLQLALQRLRRDVPKADVIVTNPTHIAVAIQYDAETMVAPKVVAKGADYLAIRIRQVAAEFGIPIVERRAVARALYESVEVGQYIPERLYKAVAEILAYIYELTGGSPVKTRPDLVGV